METRDVRLAKWIQQRAGGPTMFWRFFAGYAMYGYVVAAFLLGTLLSLDEVLVTVFIPALFVFLATLWVQYVIHRARPTVTRTEYRQWMAKYSFPSAHSSTAFCFAVLLSAVALRVAPVVAPIFIPCAFILALGIALSRVVVGVHHPSDIVAGAAFGSAIGLLFVTL